MVDSLQGGSPEEAAEKLAAYLDSADTDPTRQPSVDVPAAAREVIMRDKAEDDVQQALMATAEKFPDLAKTDDPDLPVLVVNKVDKEVTNALKGLGYTDADLRIPLGEKIKHYAYVRRVPGYEAGRALPPVGDILEKVSADVNDKYVKPRLSAQPAARRETDQRTGVRMSPDRAARKTQAQPQPRSASVRTDMTGTGKDGKRRDASSIVNDMARERGQPSAG